MSERMAIPQFDRKIDEPPMSEHEHVWFAYTNTDGSGHIAYFACACGERLKTHEADAMLNENAALKRGLAFFKSVIQSGEKWTDECQRTYDALLEASHD